MKTFTHPDSPNYKEDKKEFLEAMTYWGRGPNVYTYATGTTSQTTAGTVYFHYVPTGGTTGGTTR